jgi:hypothetical protein
MLATEQPRGQGVVQRVQSKTLNRFYLTDA